MSKGRLCLTGGRAVRVLGMALALLASCSKKPDTIVEVADTVHVTAEEIDRDPLALLPSGAIGIARIDAPAFFQSEFGRSLRALAESRAPLPPSAAFDPARDLATLYVGVYSMQGADFAVVATGTFNPQAIERAADGTTTTPLGVPLVKTTYARRTLYVSRNIGFVVLSPRTVLLGNETGIRRALDRMGEGRMRRDVPAWMDDVLRTPAAAIAAAFDFKGQPPVEAAVRNLPFLRGIRTARAVGNFQPPGINVAGSLTYPDPQAAQAAAGMLLALHGQLRSYSFLMSLVGIQNPIEKLEAVPQGSDTQFVIALQARAVEFLLNQLANQVGAPGATVPATLGPAPVNPAPARP